MTARFFRHSFTNCRTEAASLAMLTTYEAPCCRSQAFAAGLLVDITAHAHRVLLRYGLQPLPAAVTAAVWTLIQDDPESLDDGMAAVWASARTESVVRALAMALRALPPAAWQAYRLRFVAMGWPMWAVWGVGDAGEPVLAIGLDDET
jgi:hypothetical protein